MPNVVFFSFRENDRETVLTIKGRAVNPYYTNLNFRVKDLLRRWKTIDEAVIRQAISKAMIGTSRTIVFVGETTYLSKWVQEEVKMSLAAGKSVYAIRLNGTNGPKPQILLDNNIFLTAWTERSLQELAIK